MRIFLLIFVALALLLGGIFSLMYFKEKHILQVKLEIKEADRLKTEREVIVNYLQSIASDVLVLSKHHELQSLVNNEKSFSWKSLEQEFLWFSRLKKIYDQVRFLDANGLEQIRVNYNGGAPSLVPTRDLQPKGNRYYFKETFRLREGEIYVSPFDLNIEHDKIEQPQKPMIRFGTPVFNEDGRKSGVVILNFLGDNLLHRLRQLSLTDGGKILLINCNGCYLRGFNEEEEWSFMYPEKADHTFSRTFPTAWQKISQHESGQFYDAGSLYTYVTIRPFTDSQLTPAFSTVSTDASDNLVKGEQYFWKLVTYTPSTFLSTENSPLFNRIILLYAVIMALSIFGAGYLAYAIANRRRAEREVLFHRDHLAHLVDQRSAELQEANRQLQQDIAERKQVEKDLLAIQGRMQASITEKEILLKEIHHRVKNNMQVVSSLVSLQADQIDDSEKSEILNSLRHRIRSMAMIHERLYQSDDFARIDFAEYCRNLLDYLWRAYHNSSADISLKQELSPVLLAITTAIPCGLIVNELVSNALIHAFIGREHGEINIALSCDAQDMVRLCISDDGTGLPAETGVKRPRSLGLRLVHLLADQIGATISITNDRGARIIIEFSRPRD